MTCTDCDIRCASFGKHRNGLRRFRCGQCGKTYTEPHEKPLGEMTVPMEKAILALRMLLEGSSVRSVERITELHRDTILKLLVVAGEKCEKIMGRYIRNVPVKDVEVDEVWSFIGKKEKRVRPEDDQNLGDCYTFVAIERNTKLVLNIAMGKRDQQTTYAFIEGFAMPSSPVTSSRSPAMVSRRTNMQFRTPSGLRRLRDAHQGLPRRAGRRAQVFPRRSFVRGGGPSLR